MVILDDVHVRRAALLAVLLATGCETPVAWTAAAGCVAFCRDAGAEIRSFTAPATCECAAPEKE